MGRYQFIRKLGEGGNGAVYLAEDARLGKLWAVKRIPKEKALREGIFVWKDLSHPALARLADLYEDGTHLFLVMDYVEGEDLGTLRQRRHFSEEEVTGIGMQLCGLLIYLHGLSPPVICRDLKPSNILLDESGRIHVIDLDTAVRLSCGPDGTPERAAGMTYGTRGFAPPSQLRGEIGPRCDLYAAGASLLYLLGKQKASSLRQIAAKAMEEDPAAGFASAEEMMAALEKLREARREKKAAAGALRLTAALLSLILFALVRNTAEAAQEARYTKALSEGAYKEAILLHPAEAENYLFLITSFERSGKCGEGIRLALGLLELGGGEIPADARERVLTRIGMLYLLGSLYDDSFAPSAKEAERYLTGAWQALARASWRFSDEVDWEETGRAYREALKETREERGSGAEGGISGEEKRQREAFLAGFAKLYEKELQTEFTGTDERKAGASDEKN